MTGNLTGVDQTMQQNNDSSSATPQNSISTPISNENQKNPEINSNSSIDDEKKSDGDQVMKLESQYGASVEEIYRRAISFYREKNGKAFHLSYQDRNKLVAFTKQVLHGKYVEARGKDGGDDATEAGFFDVIGNDRMQAWEALGDLSKKEAMAGFVTLLDGVCPQFRLFMEAQKRDMDDKKRIEAIEDERRKSELLERQRRANEEQHLRSEEQRRQIQEALNRQTYPQFRAYAEQQFPNSPDQQHALVRQLQEQHYQQYMAQVYTQQMLQQQNQQKENHDMENDHESPTTPQATSPSDEKHFEHGDPLGTAQALASEMKKMALEKDGIPVQQHHPHHHHQQQQQVVTDGGGGQQSDGDDTESGGEDDREDDMPSNPAISPASMWTRKDIKEFKENIKKEGSEGVIKVGHGETVTVRVPTHDEGTCLFWEFSTDYYDIGFGVYFEWTISETNTVSVHISESDEEDDEDYEGDNKGDLEKGGKTDKDVGKPQQDEIIPVYRRDCHEEVYAGSHVYPGKGVYLLKFDNSYSLWRSKKLYYRVYYSK